MANSTPKILMVAEKLATRAAVATALVMALTAVQAATEAQKGLV